MKAGFINIIGAPNVGKSTLLNRLVGSKISITSPKVQTTRVAIRGIVNVENTQLVFTDTPGIFSAPQTTLEKHILKNALNTIRGGDFTLFILTAAGIKPQDRYVLNLLQHQKIYVAINKIDLVEKSSLLALAKELWEFGNIEEIFAISALKDKGVKELLQFMVNKMPFGPWHYPEDYITTASSKFIASEIIREKLYYYLQHELPYNLAVVIDKWGENPLKIYASIYVSRQSHKNIVIGEKASVVKKVGVAAREELEKIFDCKVNLFLYVKVNENWMQDYEVSLTLQNSEV